MCGFSSREERDPLTVQFRGDDGGIEELLFGERTQALTRRPKPGDFSFGIGIDDTIGDDVTILCDGQFLDRVQNEGRV